MCGLLLCSVVDGQAADFTTTLESLVANSKANASITRHLEAGKAESGTQANLPDPELEGEYLWSAGEGENKWNASISWGLEWPGVYAARRRAADTEASGLTASATLERYNLRKELAMGLLDYVCNTMKLQTINKQLQMTDSIAELVSKSSRDGNATLLDKSKINIERGRLLASKYEASQSLAQAKASIDNTFGADCSQIVGNLDAAFPTMPLQECRQYVERALKSPVAAEADEGLLLARARRAVVKAESMPSITVGYVHALEESTHYNGGRLSLSLPLFSTRGRKSAADAGVSAATAELELTNARLQTEVESVYSQLTALKGSVDELGEIFAASSPEALLWKAYTLGEITLVDYLTERNYYLDARMDYLDLQFEYQRLKLSLDLL